MTTNHPDETPDHDSILDMAIFFSGLACFAPNPVGIALSIISWGLYVSKLTMPISHIWLPFTYLLVVSIVERLATLGILELAK